MRTGQVFIDWILGNADPIDVIGAEVGVKAGRTSALLLQGVPHLQLIMVDPWCPSGDTQDYGWSLETHQEHQRKAIEKTNFAWYRRHILAMTSDYAAKLLENTGIDFVILDADHSADAVLADIYRWMRTLGVSTWDDAPKPWVGGRHILNRTAAGRRVGKQSVYDGVHKFLADKGNLYDLEVIGTSWRIMEK